MSVLDFFRKDNSKNVAKERLKLVLISDRISSSTAIMEKLRADILEVISKYMEIDEMEIDLQITKDEHEEGHRFSANIPVKNIKNNTDN